MAARFCAATWLSRQRGRRPLPTNSLLLRSAQLLGEMDAFALATHNSLPLLEYEPAFTLWWLRAFNTTPPTDKEKEGYRTYLYGMHARLTASLEYINWKLESMKTRGEWFERVFKRAREERSKEVDLAIEAEMKLLANVEAGLMSDGGALDGPAGEQSDGSSEKKEE